MDYWMKPANFVPGKTVFRRNQVISDLFARIHFGEKMGTGFERINAICRKANAPLPVLDFNESYFYITFRQNKEYLRLSGKETTPKTTQKILDMLGDNPRLTRAELARLLGISLDGAKYHLRNLKRNGSIRRAGGRKTGYWEVLTR